MFFSRAVRVGSKAPLSLLCILTLLSLIAAASVIPLKRLLTVSAASDGQRTTTSEPASQQSSAQTPPLAADAYGILPLSLEPNLGQAPEATKFLSRGAGYQISLTANEVLLKLRERPQSQTAAGESSASSEPHEQALSKSALPIHAARSAPVRMVELGMKLLGANPTPKMEAERELPGKSNYLIGNDATQWRTNISTYGQARYREIYPGVDLLFYGNQRQLEYDFIVGPGADTAQIRLAFSGANKLEIEPNGDLVLQLPDGGEMRQPAPVLYQEVDGVRRAVIGGYVLQGKNQIGFRVGAYDPKLPLVIDPVLVYSTYLSFYATSDNGGITIDAANNVYLTGANDDDVYVAKLNAAGTAFIYTTLIGGSGDGGWGDVGLGIAIDSSGNAYVSGDAYSGDFPVVNAFQSVKSSESINVPDAFVFKLDPTGSTLIFSTYLGGEDGDESTGIAVDASGNAYVTGFTESPIHYVNAPPGTPFPTVNAYQPDLAGANDAFLTKFTSTGAIVFSTYLGGADQDGAYDIAVDDQGSAYLAGVTYSSNYPVQNALQPTLKGGGDVFVTKFNPAGTALSYSTYLGGSSTDSAKGLRLDASKNIYLTGYTYSTDYPTQNAIYATKSGGADAFVTKLNAAGSALIYSTYVGGNGGEQGSDIALDAAGAAFVTGYSGSTNFPVVNPIQATNAGGADAFFFKLNAAGSALVYSTYLGGGSGAFGGGDYGQGVAIDSAGNGIFLGSTESENFPTINPIGSPNPQPYASAFLVKISESSNQTFYRISGRFESNVGNPISGVTVTLSGSQSATITTDGNLYSFTGLAAGGTYTVTPTRQGMTFDPPSQTFTNLSADQTADFMQAPRSYHITGRITDAQGNGIPDVIVDIEGYYYPAQTYTDAQGNFLMMYLEAGRTYTVTPRQDPYSFAPRSYTYPNLNSNQTPTFTALSNTHLGVNLTSPAPGATYQAAWDSNSAVGTSAPVTITVSGASWELQAPRISGLNTETLESVFMVSALEGWAGGQQGLIVHTTDGGLNWTRQTSGITDALWGISFSDALHGVAVGNTIIYTTNGGQSWQQGTGTLGTIYDVDMVDQNNGWACGGGGTIARTTNGGQTWSTQQTPIADFSNLVGLDFVDVNNGWAVGQGGTIIATTNGGTTWVNQNSNTTSYFAGVSFVSPQEGWAVAGNVFLHTTNGGQSWNPQIVPANTWAYDVDFVDANNGWAAGSQENIVRTTNGGATWTTQRPATSTYPLWSVSFADVQHGIAVGNNGTALSTIDGGQTWTRSQQTQNPQAVNRLAGTDSNHVWAGNNAGNIMYTTNGGAIWSHAVLTPSTTNDVVGIDFSDNANGWAALRNPNANTGQCSIYRSTNGGQTWQLSITASGNNHYNDIAALDAQTSVVVGSGSNFLALIRRTTDGGQTWNTMPVPASANVLYAVDFIDATTGWAAGNSNTMLKTTDGGQTWASQTVLADYLMDVSFSDANNGWAVGYYDYLHTTNGGQTWQSGNTQGYPTLQGVHTVSASTAWFVGDGYVARTLDGGATWTSETLGDFRYFRAAYFTDADNGWVGANWSTGEIYHRFGGTSPNVPQVTITEPVNGASFPAGTNLTIRASVSSTNRPIAFVDFYDGATLLGRDNTAPYSLQWNNAPAGTHSITGVATEGSGSMRVSPSTSLTIVDQPPVSISGRVTGPSGAGFANATVQLITQGSSQSLTSTTDASGNWAFANLEQGKSYTVTLSKIGDVNGISAFDASLAARFAASLIPLSAAQQLAADASDNGAVSAFDASMIARTAIGVANTGIAGTWKFLPSSLTFNSLTADQTNQNLTAVLVGDVSGNWTPAGSASMQSAAAGAGITVSLPSKRDPPAGRAQSRSP